MRTKIVCTIGPQTLSEQMLLLLAERGMSIARLNGSHADLDWHHRAIELIHRVLPELPILLDIPGRKIRTTQLENEPTFLYGDIVILTTDISHNGLEKVPVNYPNLHNDLSIGNTIMADDGTLKFTVVNIIDRDIHCRAEVSGQLKSRKGINVPFVTLNTPMLTERDKAMVEFICENNVDFVGLSFVESATHVNEFKKLINGRGPRIVAKVENHGGMRNLEEIVSAADAIMIDRGDLSVETSLYSVSISQKKIILFAKSQGKPVIVATEMLHSMINNPFPTKAEISDITNAVIDGCSATMLSGETAAGLFPLEAVDTMSKVIEVAEDYLYATKETPLNEGVSFPDAVSRMLPSLCDGSLVTKVVVITRTGYAARMLSRNLIKQPIIAVSDDLATSRSFNLLPGVSGLFSKEPFANDSSDHIVRILKMLWADKVLLDRDEVIVLGVAYPVPNSKLNTVQVFNIGKLSETYSWSK